MAFLQKTAELESDEKDTLVKKFVDFTSWVCKSEKDYLSRAHDAYNYLYALQAALENKQSEDELTWDDFIVVVKAAEKAFMLDYLKSDTYTYVGYCVGKSFPSAGAPEEAAWKACCNACIAICDKVAARLQKDPKLDTPKGREDVLDPYVEAWKNGVLLVFTQASSEQPMPDLFFEPAGVKPMFDLYTHPYGAAMKDLPEYVINMYSTALYSRTEGFECVADGVMEGCGHLADRLSKGTSYDMGADGEILYGLVSLLSTMDMTPSVPKEKIQNPGLLCRFLKISSMKLTPKQKKQFPYLQGNLDSIGQSAAGMFGNLQPPQEGAQESGATSGVDVDDLLDVMESSASIPPSAIYGLVSALQACSITAKGKASLFTTRGMDLTFAAVKKDPMQSSLGNLFKILSHCAEDKPDVALQYIDQAVELVKKASTSTYGLAWFSVIGESFAGMARIAPDKITPHWNTFKGFPAKTGSDMRAGVDMGLMAICKGLVQGLAAQGNLGEALNYSKAILDTIKNSPSKDVILSTFIIESTAVFRVSKDLITKEHFQYIQKLTTHKGPYGVDSVAIAFVDEYEGRTLRNFAKQIEEQNAKIKEACQDFDSLKKYLDENLNELKDFVAEVAKKLPTPYKFTVQEKYLIQKVIKLHFQCPYKELTMDLVGGDESEFEYEIESKEWSKWLKMGLSAAKLGKTLMSFEGLADVGDVLDQTKKIFKAYTQQDDEAFMAYANEPFLTSQEQDFLINGLRENNFFKKFKYDSRTANWVALKSYALLSEADRLKCGRDKDSLKQKLGKMNLAAENLRSLEDKEVTGDIAGQAAEVLDQAGRVMEGVEKVNKSCGWLCGLC